MLKLVIMKGIAFYPLQVFSPTTARLWEHQRGRKTGVFDGILAISQSLRQAVKRPLGE